MENEAFQTNGRESPDKIGEIASAVVGMAGNGPDILIDDLTAYAHAAEEGGYWAEVPTLPGCLTQGETLDEVVENLNDAIRGWLSVQTYESLREKKVPFTPLSASDASPARFPHVRTLELAA